MANPSRDKGTAWETALVNYLIEQGWTNAERRRLSGSADRGDIAGLPGVMIEAKNERRLDFAGYMTEVDKQRLNTGDAVAVAWVKRFGRPNPRDAYVVMTGEQFVTLLKSAGW